MQIYYTYVLWYSYVYVFLDVDPIFCICLYIGEYIFQMSFRVSNIICNPQKPSWEGNREGKACIHIFVAFSLLIILYLVNTEGSNNFFLFYEKNADEPLILSQPSSPTEITKVSGFKEMLFKDKITILLHYLTTLIMLISCWLTYLFNREITQICNDGPSLLPQFWTVGVRGRGGAQWVNTWRLLLFIFISL